MQTDVNRLFLCAESHFYKCIRGPGRATTYYDIKFGVNVHHSAYKREAGRQNVNKIQRKRGSTRWHANPSKYLCHPRQAALTLVAQQKYPALCTAACLHGPPLCFGTSRCSVLQWFASRTKVWASLISESTNGGLRFTKCWNNVRSHQAFNVERCQVDSQKASETWESSCVWECKVCSLSGGQSQAGGGSYSSAEMIRHHTNWDTGRFKRGRGWSSYFGNGKYYTKMSRPERTAAN